MSIVGDKEKFVDVSRGASLVDEVHWGILNRHLSNLFLESTFELRSSVLLRKQSRIRQICLRREICVTMTTNSLTQFLHFNRIPYQERRCARWRRSHSNARASLNIYNRLLHCGYFWSRISCFFSFPCLNPQATIFFFLDLAVLIISPQS